MIPENYFIKRCDVSVIDVSTGQDRTERYLYAQVMWHEENLTIFMNKILIINCNNEIE